MANDDVIYKFNFENAPIRGELINLKETYQAITQQYPYPAALQRLLGEALCVVGLLSALIKYKGRVTLQFKGKGKCRLMMVQSDNRFHLRGLAKYDDDLTEEDLLSSLREGILAVILDPHKKQSGYQGIVNFRHDSLATSIEGYFNDSEQLTTKVWLKVTKENAFGLLLQIMPVKNNTYFNLENACISPHWKQITKRSQAIDLEQMAHLTIPEFLQTLYPDEIITLYPGKVVSFRCTCSRKRSEGAVLLLGKKEAEEVIKEQNQMVVTCDFCNRQYAFDSVEVTHIFRKNQDINPGAIH